MPSFCPRAQLKVPAYGGGSRVESAMPTWDPKQYLKFSDHRLRPALDLMAQIPLPGPRIVYDLGCGPGTITRLLAERWRGAVVTGVDSSPDMLAKAKGEAPKVVFQQADIALWSPPAPADLIFSHSTFHWLRYHAAPPCGSSPTPRCARASPRTSRRAASLRCRCRATASRPRTC